MLEREFAIERHSVDRKNVNYFFTVLLQVAQYDK